MIYNIIVAPIEALVGWIFLFIVNKIPSLGVIGAICSVSVAINILALPLYNIAESIQEKERQINKKLEPRVKRIKKGFKGDEEFMMLSEYYRQNGYHPLYALRGSLSILIEIPFFIAAYNYLSSSEVLKESSFWIFSNLGEADRMFTLSLGSLIIPINILPIIMTAINFVSGYIYTKNATKRDKIQLYALGIFFLVLLYNSPSGLVIYWILNNIFSLVKTIVLKFFKHPGRVLHAFISVGLLLALYFCRESSRTKIFLLAFSTIIFIFFPLLVRAFRANKDKLHIVFPVSSTVFKGRYLSVVLCSGLALALLCGFMLSSSTIASSPEEFSYLGTIENPTSIVWSTLWVYMGLFVFWPLVVYKMFGEKVRKGEAVLLFSLLVVALLDTFVFNCDYGILDTHFLLDDTSVLDTASLLSIIGPVVGILLAMLLYVFVNHFDKGWIISLLALSIAIGEFAIGITKMNVIEKGFSEYKILRAETLQEDEENIDLDNLYTLSKEGKNVVVIFLDRAIGSFFPYALNQIEELNEEFKGFIYYPNTISFGGCTVLGAPAMMGGYEYTPEMMNSRDGLLKDLHNEASVLAPTLFSNAGYSVTVTNPPFPNYSQRDDLSAFDEVKNIKAVVTYGEFLERYYKEFNYTGLTDDAITKEIEMGAVNFSLLQILPQLLRSTFYFNCIDFSIDYTNVLAWLSNLYYLPSSTSFEGVGNTYTFIGNETTHYAEYLNEDLLLSFSGGDKFESTIPADNERAEQHYNSFCAAIKELGRWFDYLRENDCYDNTRIVVVSDHGFKLNNGIIPAEQSQFNPLLLVKNFNSNNQLEYDYTFMTNADTIFLLTEDLDEIENVNPYTGNELVQQKYNGVDAYEIQNNEWNATILTDRTQFTLNKGTAYHIEGNMFDEASCTPLLEWEEMNK